MEVAILLAFLLLRFALRHPAVLVHLGLAGQRQSPRRHVLGDGRAGRDVGAVPDRDGGDELYVTADEGLLADPGRVVLLAVVVAGDDARADVRTGAHVGVAEIREVLRLDAPAEHGVLGLDEVADAHLFLVDGAGPRTREGPHAGARADGGLLELAVWADDRSLRDE